MRMKHPMYGKFVLKRKNIPLMMKTMSATEGDKVLITETRPLSKKKDGD